MQLSLSLSSPLAREVFSLENGGAERPLVTCALQVRVRGMRGEEVDAAGVQRVRHVGAAGVLRVRHVRLRR